jgi:2-keto-4-pentenoate hydratase/2-oxohepta-3-ene-1,7-dioic acid hydratase in catechol pathway
MKLTRFYSGANITPGVLADDARVLDASAFGEDWNEAFFETDGLLRLADWLAGAGTSAPRLALKDLRLAPAIARPSKIVCIGLNYADHARESGMTPPTEPVLFFKSTSAWSGPNDDLVIPKGSEKTDWEVELAVVIGRRASYVSEADALDYVAGYALHNDYSERAWQLEGTGQWVKGKSADTYAPFGPFLATKDEVADVHNLRLWLKVNGETMQDGNTANFIFNVPHVVSYVSQFMTLLPGDVISTGTPAGVGLGLKPPRYLKPGDVIELGIDGLGEQRQKAVAYVPR